MIVSSIVLAYHGCDRSVAEEVIHGKKELKASENAYDWLGSGIYFWENSPLRALRWAEFLRDHPKVSKSKIKEPAVIGAVIELGNCLDLTDQVSLDLLQEMHSVFKALYEELGLTLPVNEKVKEGDDDLLKRYLDCAVINFSHELCVKLKKLDPFDTVRGVFFEGGSLFEGSKIRARSHIQIAARNPKKIHGYFWPRNVMG